MRPTRFLNSLYEGRQWSAAREAGESKGWTLSRINGSHHIYTQPGRPERVVIPIHGNRSLKIGLQKSLMRIIPLSEDEL
jgi:predicted RNA binding protein YcfA (HicA-like mRNA interferase family)